MVIFFCLKMIHTLDNVLLWLRALDADFQFEGNGRLVANSAPEITTVTNRQNVFTNESLKVRRV